MVLAVEDEPLILMLAVDMIRDAGFERERAEAFARGEASSSPSLIIPLRYPTPSTALRPESRVSRRSGRGGQSTKPRMFA